MSRHQALRRSVVLLVEKDDETRQSMTSALSSRTFDVLTAKDSVTASMILRLHEGPIDVLVTDLDLPGVSGSELARSARVMRTELLVVFATNEDLAAGVAAGKMKYTDRVIPVPYPAETLVDTVRAALDRKAADAR